MRPARDDRIARERRGKRGTQGLRLEGVRTQDLGEIPNHILLLDIRKIVIVAFQGGFHIFIEQITALVLDKRSFARNECEWLVFDRVNELKPILVCVSDLAASIMMHTTADLEDRHVECLCKECHDAFAIEDLLVGELSRRRKHHVPEFWRWSAVQSDNL